MQKEIKFTCFGLAELKTIGGKCLHRSRISLFWIVRPRIYQGVSDTPYLGKPRLQLILTVCTKYQDVCRVTGAFFYFLELNISCLLHTLLPPHDKLKLIQEI